jgi:hypothetical protein
MEKRQTCSPRCAGWIKIVLNSHNRNSMRESEPGTASLDGPRDFVTL